MGVFRNHNKAAEPSFCFEACVCVCLYNLKQNEDQSAFGNHNKAEEPFGFVDCVCLCLYSLKQNKNQGARAKSTYKGVN